MRISPANTSLPLKLDKVRESRVEAVTHLVATRWKKGQNKPRLKDPQVPIYSAELLAQREAPGSTWTLSTEQGEPTCSTRAGHAGTQGHGRGVRAEAISSSDPAMATDGFVNLLKTRTEIWGKQWQCDGMHCL